MTEDSKPSPRTIQPEDHDESIVTISSSAVAPDGTVSSTALRTWNDHNTTTSDTDEDTRRKEERRRKRRRLKNYMHNQGNNPLFTNFLTNHFDTAQNDEIIVIDDSDDDDDDDNADHDRGGHELRVKYTKPMAVVDVDVHLGLKETPPDLEPTMSSILAKPRAFFNYDDDSYGEGDEDDDEDYEENGKGRIYTRSAKRETVAAAASSHFSIHTENQDGSSPGEEGWYEGVVSPIAMPEDASFLNPVHCFVRMHLDFFSANDRTSRRTRGRVGMRCKHCAAQAEDDPSPSWPTGSLSYPNSFASVHQACAQRFQVHWQTQCPCMPPELRAQFNSLLLGSQQTNNKRNRGGLPAPVYYTLCMQRLGIVETADGLRFSRDLSIEPLPLEAVRATMEAQTTATTSVEDPYPRVGGMEVASSMPAMVPSTAGADAAMKESRGQIDEGSERVLAECIAQADQPDKYLARGSDKTLVTDYVFITIRQMALCYALPADMSSRGKKTKMLHLGLAGFCCRFCLEAAGGGNVFVPHSCRSFLSAPDNLGSAISNSFTMHLQKCPHVPRTIQKAMAAFKRIHQRQMGLLPYGGQRRFFHLLWDRLREADKSTAEIEAHISQIASQEPAEEPTNGSHEVVSIVKEAVHHLDSPSREAKTNGNGLNHQFDLPVPPRPENFPESKNEETRRILQEAESGFIDKKFAASQLLLLLGERNLVSDYVFLTIMQLRPTAPSATDGGRNYRRVGGGVMGVCCIHCANREQLAPSGRSFPSAPDNFASALNTSLFKHMQACTFIAPELKRALADLRSLHSSQCSSLFFGSQRRYFVLLFGRLRSMYQDTDASIDWSSTVEAKETVESLGFLKLNHATADTVTYICKRCRMVPVTFRSRDAVCYDRQLSVSRARNHRNICQEDGLDLTLTVESYRVAANALKQEPDALIQEPLFKSFLGTAIGNDAKLLSVLVDDVLAMLHPRSQSSEWETPSSNHSPVESRRGLWKRFPTNISFDEVENTYQALASSLGIDSKLHEMPALLQYLMIVSPFLSIPENTSHEYDGGSTEQYSAHAPTTEDP